MCRRDGEETGRGGRRSMLFMANSSGSCYVLRQCTAGSQVQMLSERRLSYNALGPVPGFSILYLSFSSLVLTESTGFADRKRIVRKPRVTEVLSPKAESPIKCVSETLQPGGFVQRSKIFTR